ADVSMAHADVSVDQVNIDSVNVPRSRGPTSQSVGLFDRWDPRVSAVKMKKNKKNSATGRKSSWASFFFWANGLDLAHFFTSFFFSSPLFLLQLTSWSHLS